MRGRVLAAVCVLFAAHVVPAEAQVRWRDLVVTMGGSMERYTGNFSAVTVPVVDSTDHATASVAEVGVRGSLLLLEQPAYTLTLDLDGGVRQAAATGFRLRDYAPREWVGTGALRVRRALGSAASLTASLSAQTRSVHDRPPMPLFLQPGFSTFGGTVGVSTRSYDGVSFDVEAAGETADYRALEFLPQLDLLDRRSAGVEAGANWSNSRGWIRFFAGLRWSEYRHQPSFDPSDPFRRDRSVRAGLTWTHRGALFVQVGLEGVLNRSNSNRPEYDALSASALVTAPLPGDVTLNVYALLTGKSYVHETDFARLVPGEEADNASVAFVQLARAVASNLDAALRLGWTRAETDIADAYYQRFGLSLRMHYRPF